MPLVGLGFTTSNAQTGARISANATINGGTDLNFTGATTLAGYPWPAGQGFLFANVGVGPGSITLTAPGFKDRVISGRFPEDFPANVDYKMEPDGSAPTTLHLEVRGNDFVDVNGQPTCYSCVDQFIAFRMWLDGRFDELEALVAESKEFGFQWWRVFFQGSKAQNTIFDLSPNEPRYYDQVRPFIDWLNARGIGVLAVIGVDNQDVKSPMPQHWGKMADLIRGAVAIYDGGNEAPKNGFDPQAIPNLSGIVWSRGSGLADEVTPQNGATCCSFHQRTDFPATIMDAAASAVYMTDHGYTVLMMDEPTRFDQDGSNKSGQPNSPRFAFALARIYSAEWDLVCFHNGAGQRGQLMSPALRAIASEWSRALSA